MPLPIYRFASLCIEPLPSSSRFSFLKEDAEDRLLLDRDYVMPIDIIYVVVGQTNGKGLIIFPTNWPTDNIVRDSHIDLWTLYMQQRGLHPHQYFESPRYRLIGTKILKEGDILPDLSTFPE